MDPESYELTYATLFDDLSAKKERVHTLRVAYNDIKDTGYESEIDTAAQKIQNAKREEESSELVLKMFIRTHGALVWSV
jgi:hypothetical protein